MTHDLLDDLRHADPRRQEQGLILARFMLDEPHEETVCQALVEHLRSSKEDFRAQAAEALVKRECRCATFRADLFRALQDPSPRVREQLLILFRDYPLDDPNRSQLGAFLQDPAERVRLEAARTHWKHFRDAELIRPIVVAALASRDRACVIKACHFALEMPSERPWLAEPLRAVVRSWDEPIQGQALYALHKLGDDKAVLLTLCEETANAVDLDLRFARSRILKNIPGAA